MLFLRQKDEEFFFIQYTSRFKWEGWMYLKKNYCCISEHRTFLEVAHTHQSSFVFAITTYTAGTLGLPPSPYSGEPS